MVDLNGDGWLDVIKSSRKGRTDIWLAHCGSEAWTQVMLNGPPGNPHGLGARVTMEADGHIFTRWMTSGAPGYLLSAPYRLHFGLGAAVSIDSMHVEWSDGHLQSWTELEPRQVLTATHPDSELSP